MTDSMANFSSNTSAGRFSRTYPRLLLIFFVLSLPLINPIVHGDGVGYYAYARAPLIQHNLQFEEDWRHANLYFHSARIDFGGQVLPNQYTQTAHIGNLFSVGPAILWSPFLLLAHIIVLIADFFGAHIPADGFSAPYILAMAIGTAIYGFLGLFLSFALAKKYVSESWAFLATLGIWTATSLPVYMYFNPAWSHAHSVFAVSLFLWFWDRTRGSRTTTQWILLGLVSGLMVDVYFPNGVFLLLPLIESILAYRITWDKKDAAAMRALFIGNLVFTLLLVIAVLPTLITRRIVFGGFTRLGAYSALPWDWRAPHWRDVLFSSNHGLLTWTPILVLALAGLFFPTRSAKAITLYLSAAGIAFYYVISSYPYWDGMSSFGNRFFISLTPVFIFGLSLFLERIARTLRSDRRSFVAATALLVVFAIWNGAFIFQWGAHLISVRGPISFSEMIHNQFFVVPREFSSRLHAYLFQRKTLMEEIERRDIKQMNDAPPP